MTNQNTNTISISDPVIMPNGTVDITKKDELCPCCCEAYKRRQVKRAKNGSVVHSTCLDQYEQEMREAENARRRAEEERQRAEAQAKREAIRKLRGDDIKAWGVKVWEDDTGYPENERQLTWKMEKQLSTVKHYDEVRAKFAENMLSDPEHALHWSLGMFEATAEWKIAQQVIEWWQAGLTYDQIIGECKERALREMRSPTRSTSPTANIMEQCMGAAWAKVADRW